MYRKLVSAVVCTAAFVLAFGASAGCGAPAAPEAVTAEPSPTADPFSFVVRECAGAVCVFHSGYTEVPAIVTEIRVDGLPEADRQLLSDGIEVSGREALLRLLEDLGS